MLFERKITYLDYIVRGERCGVGGFVKTERRDKICNITLQINLNEVSASYVVKVNLIGEQEKEFCKLEVIGGKANRVFREINIMDIGGTGISYDEMVGIRVVLSPEREIYGKIKDKQNEAVMEETLHPNENHIVVAEAIEQQEKDTVVAEDIEQTEKNIVTVEMCQSNENESAGEHIWETVRCEEHCSKALWIQDDKWRQLWEIYPHISPFQDEREYLSIGPNDFVILPGKYFRIANNSFLLHGYHNYRHLVLKKSNRHGEEKYYIGVPGNFYEREKQVAVMFGFEGFESLKEPASPGDYGYYMMGIEL